jgi:23S rRNA (cytosine1962-C5)-methyltransferase
MYGAEQILGMDNDPQALNLAKKNAQANRFENLLFASGDVYAFLTDLVPEKQKFHAVILDPPPMDTGSRFLKGNYNRFVHLNALAIANLKPGGFLITTLRFLPLGETLFLEILREAANQCGRSARILEFKTQSRDHPLHPGFPESSILRLAVLEV